ncbi:MAG: fumarate hydratase C-terminal domain-containing protein [Solobacterium sp.]|nr:fumarate hydratase C-terminal domain-containing protein [Solobacterium sp.]
MKRVTLPASSKDLRDLQAGEPVLLSGTVYTARDAAHKRMIELLEQRKELPIPMKDAAIYYVGPTPAPKGRPIGSAGPTTSSRMDAYTPALLDQGLTVMIGKGRRSAEVKEAIVTHGAVYFVACGGAGALLAHHIKKAEPVAFEDLLAEAIVRLTLEDFPCFVGVDSFGDDVYDQDQ